MITYYPADIAGQSAAFATPEPRSIHYDNGQYVVRTGADYEAPPVEVIEVSMRAFRRALVQIGLRNAVETYINAASIEVRDDWSTAPTMHRDNAIITAAATALGKGDADLDALFALAQQIEASL